MATWKFPYSPIKAIEIERKKRDRLLVKTGSDHQSLGRLEKTTTVRNTCQRVDQRNVLVAAAIRSFTRLMNKYAA